MKPTKKTTYLSRIRTDMSAPKFYSRSVTLFCTLLFAGQWIRKAQTMRCLVFEISEGSASVRIGKAQVPDNLYFVIGKFDVVVGSIVVQREPGVLHLRFVKQLKPDFVNRLARMTSPFATLESLNPNTISEGENLPPSTRPPAPALNRALEDSTGQNTKLTK